MIYVGGVDNGGSRPIPNQIQTLSIALISRGTPHIIWTISTLTKGIHLILHLQNVVLHNQMQMYL